MIIDGKIKEHEKLPPIRKLSEYIGVNNTTIVKVYELLEKEGYVYKIIESGTFASELKKYRAKDNKKIKILFSLIMVIHQTKCFLLKILKML